MSKVLVQGIHVEVTEAIESHATEQFKKVLDHFESLVVENIEMKVEVSNHHSHINVVSVKVPVPGNDIQITEEGDDMYAVISSVAQKVHRKLRKIKEKSNSKTGHNKRDIQE